MIFKLTLSRQYFDKEEEQEMNNLKEMGFHFEKIEQPHIYDHRLNEEKMPFMIVTSMDALKDFAEKFEVYNFNIDFRATTIEVQNGYAK